MSKSQSEPVDDPEMTAEEFAAQYQVEDPAESQPDVDATEEELNPPASTGDEDVHPAEEDAGGEQEPAPEVESELPTFDHALLGRAEALGLTEAEWQGFSPERLEAFVSGVEARSGTPAPDGEVKPGEEGDEKPVKDKPGQEEATGFQLELDPDLYEPELVKAFKDLAAHNQEELAAMQERVDQLTQQQTTESDDAVGRWFDGFVEGLGPQYADLFGVGPGLELEQGSAHLKNRIAVLKEMDARYDRAQRDKTDLPDDDKLARQSVASVFPDKAEQLVTGKIASSVQRRSGQVVGRPSGRRTKTAGTPTQEAEGFVREFLDDVGEAEDEAEDFAGIQPSYPVEDEHGDLGRPKPDIAV